MTRLDIFNKNFILMAKVVTISIANFLIIQTIVELLLRVLKGKTCKCADGNNQESDLAEFKKRLNQCKTEQQKCLTCPLNSLRKLISIKGFLCSRELYDKKKEIVCLSIFITRYSQQKNLFPIEIENECIQTH
ncbi:unnamed protein product [Paramecium sonneborni]|uniref:Uncharacterized protein n=1 Tax=Paramecium sonneborni TaxID=65129 RepID=A0A8S1QH66_9CILI|nr:unnamed protein product [Paramecium sonneborni]